MTRIPQTTGVVRLIGKLLLVVSINMDNFLEKIFLTKSFGRRQALFNSTKSLRYEIEPRFLFSYGTKILELDEDDNITIYYYREKYWITQTTSVQIGRIMAFLRHRDIPFDCVIPHGDDMGQLVKSPKL